MNNSDHISKSFETRFWVKILKFFDADPGSGMEKNRIRNTVTNWSFGIAGNVTVAHFLVCPFICA